MTRAELRVFLAGWFCGCGAPDDAAFRLKTLLELHPLYDHRAEFEKLIPDVGLQYLILYTLDHFDLAEHGGSVGGEWLTEKGEAVLEALKREPDFSVFSVNCCIHGVASDGTEGECAGCVEWRQGQQP